MSVHFYGTLCFIPNVKTREMRRYHGNSRYQNKVSDPNIAPCGIIRVSGSPHRYATGDSCWRGMTVADTTELLHSSTQMRSEYKTRIELCMKFGCS